MALVTAQSPTMRAVGALRLFKASWPTPPPLSRPPCMLWVPMLACSVSCARRRLWGVHMGLRDAPLCCTPCALQALGLLLEAGVSALPVVDEKRCLLDIYARSDITNLAKANAYSQLQWEDVTVRGRAGAGCGRAGMPVAGASSGTCIWMCVGTDGMPVCLSMSKPCAYAPMPMSHAAVPTGALDSPELRNHTITACMQAHMHTQAARLLAGGAGVERYTRMRAHANTHAHTHLYPHFPTLCHTPACRRAGTARHARTSARTQPRPTSEHLHARRQAGAVLQMPNCMHAPAATHLART